MKVVFCEQFWMELGFLMGDGEWKMEDGRSNLGFCRGLDCGVCVEMEGTKRSWRSSRPNKSLNIWATTSEGVT
jgi:hypothetical protein